jgi:predicted Na+-dependent transporter
MSVNAGSYMSKILSGLTAAGRHGPLLLCVGVLIGLLLPQLAGFARPLMGGAVFVFTLGAFLKVERSAFIDEARSVVRLMTVLAWTTFGVPIVAYVLVAATAFPSDIDVGIVLATLAPPVGSAAAIAAMLGLNTSLALIATVAATVATPLYLPALAQLMIGADISIDTAALAMRLALIIGGAAMTSYLLRRFARHWVNDNPHAMTGLSVVGLIVVAIGAMHGMDAHILADPGRAAEVLLLAFGLNIGLQLFGAAMFVRLGSIGSLTVGLVSGNRNVTLVWAAATPLLVAHPDAELFLAMSVFPIFMLPLVTKQLMKAYERLSAPRRRRESAIIPSSRAARG